MGLLKTQQNDQWAALPTMKETVISKQVVKVNEHIKENEFHCRIPTSESLVKSKPKSVKIKLAEVEHNFDP